MGSFNTACFASKQVIVPGIRAYLFPIQQAYGQWVECVDPKRPESVGNLYTPHSSTCYSTGFWEYFGMPLIGTYADYGRFEIEPTPVNMQVLRGIFQKISERALETKPGENQYHQTAFKVEDDYSQFTDEQLIVKFDELWNSAVYEARVFVKSSSGVPRLFSFATMLESTVDWIRADAKKRKNWRKQIVSEDTLMDSIFTKEHGMSMFHVESFIRNIDGMKTYKDEPHHVAAFKCNAITAIDCCLSSASEFCFGFEYRSTANLINFIDSDVVDDCARSAIDYFFDKEINTDDVIRFIKDYPGVSEILRHYVIGGLIDLRLNEMQIPIIPNYYAGQDYDSGKLYAKMVSAVQRANDKQIEEQYD